MLRYLLDTDICSYAIKRKEARLLGRIREGLIAEEIAISVITRGELLYGLALLPEAASLSRAVHAFSMRCPASTGTRKPPIATRRCARARKLVAIPSATWIRKSLHMRSPKTSPW